jgi:hypothetical protein
MPERAEAARLMRVRLYGSACAVSDQLLKRILRPPAAAVELDHQDVQPLADLPEGNVTPTL